MVKVEPGGRINIKMSSYRYRKPHCGDKTILRPSYLHNGISYTDKMIFLYWIRAQDTKLSMCADALAKILWNWPSRNLTGLSSVYSGGGPHYGWVCESAGQTSGSSGAKIRPSLPDEGHRRSAIIRLITLGDFNKYFVGNSSYLKDISIIINQSVWQWCKLNFTWRVKKYSFFFLVMIKHMMTSSNGNIFRVTGHLCGELTGPRSASE